MQPNLKNSIKYMYLKSLHVLHRYHLRRAFSAQSHRNTEPGFSSVFFPPLCLCPWLLSHFHYLLNHLRLFFLCVTPISASPTFTSLFGHRYTSTVFL